jgi:hypothetical protein
MTTWTDEEFGDVAEALEWPRDRVWRYPIFPWLSGPDQPAQLDGRLSFVSASNKALVLDLAREILARKKEARDELFDGLPDVTRAGEIYKDARLGYESRKRALDDMRQELARLVDYYLNPSYAPAGETRVIG